MIVDCTMWTKDGDLVTSDRYWRSGEVRCVCDTKPEIASNNPPDIGINVQNYFQSTGEYNLFTSIHSQIVGYPVEMRRKTREDLNDVWEEHETLTGWDVCGTELWFFDFVIKN